MWYVIFSGLIFFSASLYRKLKSTAPYKLLKSLRVAAILLIVSWDQYGEFMNPLYESYFDHRFLMKPWGGNSILYTSQYAILTNKDVSYCEAITAAISFIKSAKLELSSGESFSHDDMTAVVCLDKLYSLPKSITTNIHRIDWKSRLHPRDLIFYAYALGGMWRILSSPFLWILTICMVESVLNDTYKTINDRAVLATDGALLTFVRLHTFSFPITQWLVNLSLKYHKRNWSDYFRVYFGVDHPNYILSKEFV